MRIAIATCKRLPEPDHDEALLLAALSSGGGPGDVEVRALAWDDEAAPFLEQDVVVLRSTWNYHERVDDFVAWAARIGAATLLLNPPHVVAWNASKTYLTDLERRGVATVPTEFVMRGTQRDLGELLAERAWDEIVIKPVVSAGSFRTERFSGRSVAAAQSFLDDLAADRGAMVQRWMPAVETSGERSLVWIDGAFTHAIRKSPRFSGGAEQVSADVLIADDERSFAERALAPFASELLYARVDMVRDTDGALRLMELELIEPSLYLQQSPSALERLVAAVLRRCRAARGAQDSASR